MPQSQHTTEAENVWSHEITDSDIRWAAQAIGLPRDAFLGQDGSDPRREVLQCMGTIDVAACPGSGKTTLLVAKLAILAKKWSHRTRGICVLSHTNVARREMEARLGNTSVGRALLSYPHFVGTIHAFVNEFLAIPQLRSVPYPIKIIDSRICETRRWMKIPHNSRYALSQRQIDASSIRIADCHFTPTKKVGKFPFGAHTQTFKDVMDAFRQSALDGFHCHEDMFIWGNKLLDSNPYVAAVLRERFPLLFIDEAQDNSNDQAAIIHRVFMKEPSPVVRQRFGDGNQAIFNSVGQAGATADLFPDDSVKRDLPNSHSFGEKIGDIANPLGLCPCGLVGQGPKQPLASGSAEAPHTLFLFADNQARSVLDAYADVLLETFSDQGLHKGSFIAVGQVHKDGGDDHRPRHVGHYWPDYDPELAGIDPAPRSFVQHVLVGQSMVHSIGEAFPVVEKVAQGLLRLGATAPGATGLRTRRHSHGYVLELLESDKRSRFYYTLLLSRIAVRRKVLSRQAWEGRWREIVRTIGETIAGSALSHSEADAFLEWPLDANAQPTVTSSAGSRDNIYRYCNNGREVAIRIGSIHSVKGETHTATLVVETFYRAHNLAKLKPWIVGVKNGWSNSSGNVNKDRLKLHYVAMTRPTHLLCLAMMKSTFVNSQGELDTTALESCSARGLRIKQL